MKVRGWIAVTMAGDDAAAAAAPHASPAAAAARPLRSIQAAIGRAGPGTAILVHAGRYAENLRIGGRRGEGSEGLRALSAEAPLWILGADGFDAKGLPKAKILGAARRSTLFVTGISHVKIHNLEIRGREGLGDSRDEAPVKFIGARGEVAPERAAGRFELAGCRISGEGTDALKAGKARDLRIRGCVFEVDVPESMVDFVSVLDSEVRDCEFLGHAKDGAAAKGASGRILWEGNVFRYAGNYCCAIGWSDPAIMIGGIGWSREDRDMPPDRWNVECFDSIARRNLFAGAFEHAVSLWGARNCLIERNFIDHRGAPGRLWTPRHAWRSETAPSSPWRNQWAPHATTAARRWPEIQAAHLGRLDRLGYATSGGNLIRENYYRMGAGFAPGFSKNAEDPAAPNRILDAFETTEEAWRAAMGPVGPEAHDRGAIRAALGLPR